MIPRSFKTSYGLGVTDEEVQTSETISMKKAKTCTNIINITRFKTFFCYGCRNTVEVCVFLTKTKCFQKFTTLTITTTTILTSKRVC